MNMRQVSNELFMMDRNESLPTQHILIDYALKVVTRQMEALGRRDRTIEDYKRYMNSYTKTTNQTYIDEITLDSIYSWLDSMDVQASTKRIRLKALKAILGKFYDNGWVEKRFWANITIKVDKKVKPCASERDVALLLSMLDLTNFIELRDACAILLMYRCGLRLGTIATMQEEHIDFQNQCLDLTGDVMKNHELLKLPVDEVTLSLLETLIQKNKTIRHKNKKRNSLVFINKFGNTIQPTYSNNAIRKRLSIYSKMTGLENIDPHALRRGFATNLLKHGASVPLISKALGHSDIAVTTQYLYLDTEQVASELRRYL